MMNEKFSSAPSYQSPYTADDYDENGKLKRLKEVPLGSYPTAIAAELDSHNSSDLSPPVMPAPPPQARSVQMGPPPVNVMQDPPEFQNNNHCIALVSWVVNRHPQEDQIVDHYIRQVIAKRENCYDPMEDPPVDLRQIIPTVCVKVTRTFTREEAESNEGRQVRQFAERLHRATDANIITLECGKFQPLPVSDSIRGIYKDKGLQQQMDAFYKQLSNGRIDIEERIKQDAAAGSVGRKH